MKDLTDVADKVLIDPAVVQGRQRSAASSSCRHLKVLFLSLSWV